MSSTTDPEVLEACRQFNEHQELCEVCRDSYYNLCKEGKALLEKFVDALNAPPKI
jgi:hypothetical protein